MAMSDKEGVEFVEWVEALLRAGEEVSAENHRIYQYVMGNPCTCRNQVGIMKKV